MISRIDTADYRGEELTSFDDSQALTQWIADQRLMVLATLDTILTRYERQPDTPFIDTKLNLLNGSDFAADDPIRGRGLIYAWIQGRGLEALAGHAMWLRRCDWVTDNLRENLTSRIRTVLADVLASMEAIRQRNNGRLTFVMTPAGEPLAMDASGVLVPSTIPADAPANFSELFYVKGLATAAHVLGREELLIQACQWYRRIDEDIRLDRFRSDQISLDANNPSIGLVEGRRGHGPRMIAIGAAFRFLELTGDPIYRDMGQAYIDHILRYHVNVGGSNGQSVRYDMWEFIDEAGQPWPEGDVLRSDAGHTCEFVGLAMRLLRTCRQTGTAEDFDPARLTAYMGLLPEVLKRNFANGFNGCGIAKGFDLVSREAINTDMPWWSLPETMRAALEVRAAVGNARGAEFAEIARQCANAFAAHYVRPDLHLMAYQTLSADGTPVDVPPATPDADPGYHTGLSIIDCLDVLT